MLLERKGEQRKVVDDDTREGSTATEKESTTREESSIEHIALDHDLI